MILVADVKETVVQGLPDWIVERPDLRRRLRETITEPTPVHRMTYEEFLEWADEDTLVEWVDGEIVVISPASNRHQNLCGFLSGILRMFVETRGLGDVRSAPFQMKLEHGREPDVLFIATQHADRLRETFLDGPADLVVEITSPESLERDRGAKFVEYEAGKVPEYWLIDPLRRWAEFYQLGEEGRYRTAFADQAGVYRSQLLPGFWLQVEWLWQEPLPNLARVAWEILGVDALRQVLREMEQQERKMSGQQ